MSKFRKSLKFVIPFIILICAAGAAWFMSGLGGIPRYIQKQYSDTSPATLYKCKLNGSLAYRLITGPVGVVTVTYYSKWGMYLGEDHPTDVIFRGEPNAAVAVSECKVIQRKR